MDNDPVALTARLVAANSFDLDALPANRAGRLTAAQRRRLRTRLRSSRRNSWVPKIGCFAALAFLIHGAATGTLSGGTALSVAFLAFVTGWVGFVIPHYGGFGRNVSSGVVANLDGVVTRKHEVGGDYFAMGGGDDHYYVLGDARFRVSRTGYDALVDGVRCRIYYLPDARTDDRQVMSPMVNIEALSDG
ncbi:hypothetical protein [Flexivirga oryzae]|uniref:Uncharacterized protein n=1 Tax=Flexivirga oryzae TaxID=1794944 RepID=A0A839NDQ0_9MICO|nr:hypothetical protein [Flexivirga oryzae]MBB2892652.1 hypothetical protein [Flexivirga oryzae]